MTKRGKNMSVRLVVMTLMIAIGGSLFGQKTYEYTGISGRWRDAKSLYDNGLYVSAQRAFNDILLLGGDEYSAYKTEAAYYVAACALQLSNNDAEHQILSFLGGYPESPKCNDATYDMANYKFRNKKYKAALKWYEQVDRLSLPPEQQTEYFFKIGFSHFARKDFDKAAKAFYEVKDSSGSIYGDMALYFYSHIKYLNSMYGTALKGFRKLEHNRTFAAIAPFYISQLLYLLEDYEAVVDYVPPLLDSVAGPRRTELDKIVGSAYYHLHRYSEAVPYLESCMAALPYPSNADYYELGYAYFCTQKYEKAAANFRKITALKDTLGQNSAYHLAGCYIKMNQKTDARMAFESAARYNFNPTIREDAMFNFAQLSFELEMSPFNEAIAAFSAYIDEYPNSPRVDLAYDYLINAFLSTKKYKDVIEIIEKMPNRNTKINAVYQRLTYFRGLELFTALKYNEAIAMFDKSLEHKIYDKNLTALAHYWRAEADYRLGNVDEAIERFKEFVNTTGSVSLDEYGLAHYNIGYAYFNKKEYATANSWFRKFEMQPVANNNTLLNDVLNRIGDCYFISKDFKSATNYYKKAGDIGKINHDYSLYQLALSLGGQKKYDEKVWALRKLTTDFPSSEYAGNATYEIGRTFSVSLNKPDSAKFYYNKLITNYPNSAVKKTAMSGLAMIYFNERNFDEALRIYKSIITTYPGTDEADYANDMIKAIYIEQDNADEYIEYANAEGVDISRDEQDEIMWLAAKKLYVDKKYNEALVSLTNYLNKFPQGKFHIEANYFKAELHYYFEEKDLALASYKVVAEAAQGAYTEESTLKAAGILFDKKEWTQAYDYYNRLYTISENKSTKFVAALGRLRTSYESQQWDNVITAATDIIENERSNEENTREAMYKMAKAYYAKNNKFRAMSLFETLSKEVVSYEGAESKYTVAALHHEMRNDSLAEEIIYEFARSNSPQSYWVAKSLILLSDIYYDAGDMFSAKQTLQTVLSNYTDETDDIKTIAAEKMQKIVDEEAAAKTQEVFMNIDVDSVQPPNDDKPLDEDILPQPKQMPSNDSIAPNTNTGTGEVPQDVDNQHVSDDETDDETIENDTKNE